MKMKKTFISVFTIFIGLALVSSTAFPWGSATHAYIDDHIGKRFGLKNKNEIYGGMAPDIFNYAFDLPQALFDYLHDETHGVYGEIFDDEKYFMKVWNKARWGFQENLAYGFVSHNDMWGADSTAHWQARVTSPPPGFPVGELPSGYIIYKAFELEIMLGAAWIELGLDAPGYYELRIELCHHIVEAAGDIFLKEYGDSRIGRKISTSALFRGPSFPLLLIKAYARDLCDNNGMSYAEAVGLITTAEKEYRKNMILLGQVLRQDMTTAIDLTAEQFAELAIGFLDAKGIDLGVTPEELKPKIVEALWASMLILDDYMDEVNATIDFVKHQLELHGVSY